MCQCYVSRRAERRRRCTDTKLRINIRGRHKSSQEMEMHEKKSYCRRKTKLPGANRNIISPIPFALYPHSKYVSTPASFLPGLASNTSCSSSTLASASNTKTKVIDRTRNIKHEEEQELLYKDVVIKLKEALGMWIHACQSNSITKPTMIKKDTKSFPNTSKCPTIVLLTIKKPPIPQVMALPSLLSIPSLSLFTSFTRSNQNDNETLEINDEANTQATSYHNEDNEDNLESISTTSSDYPVLGHTKIMHNKQRTHWSPYIMEITGHTTCNSARGFWNATFNSRQPKSSLSWSWLG